MNIAHFFTLIRIFITPLFPLVYLLHEKMGIPFVFVPYLMLSLLLICECSDVFDGFLARKRNQVTDLGKILDPVADSLMHISLFLAFTKGIVELPLFFVFVFLYRELMIGALRTLCALRGIALGARVSGKIKAVMQGVVCFVIIFLMIPYSKGMISIDVFRDMVFYLTSLVALYTIISLGDYVYANRSHIQRALKTA